MRVLILTGRFGMGHIAAAQALQQEILREDPTTDVRTSLKPACHNCAT